MASLTAGSPAGDTAFLPLLDASDPNADWITIHFEPAATTGSGAAGGSSGGSMGAAGARRELGGVTSSAASAPADGAASLPLEAAGCMPGFADSHEVAGAGDSTVPPGDSTVPPGSAPGSAPGLGAFGSPIKVARRGGSSSAVSEGPEAAVIQPAGPEAGGQSAELVGRVAMQGQLASTANTASVAAVRAQAALPMPGGAMPAPGPLLPELMDSAWSGGQSSSRKALGGTRPEGLALACTAGQLAWGLGMLAGLSGGLLALMKLTWRH